MSQLTRPDHLIIDKDCLLSSARHWTVVKYVEQAIKHKVALTTLIVYLEVDRACWYYSISTLSLWLAALGWAH